MGKRIGALLCFVAGVAATLLVTGVGLDAARAKAVLDIRFGPGQVQAMSDGAFLLTLNNTGTADASFRLGDTVDVLFRIGDRGGDLLADGGALVADDLPAAAVLQDIVGGGGVVQGVQLAFQGNFVVPPGDGIVIVLRGPSSVAGSAAVQVNSKISRKTAKAPKRQSFVVVKTPSEDETLFVGDGSDGPLDVAADTALEPLMNYTDVLIREGVTVTVPSGTTIRCTGTFENRGTIVVGPGAPGGGVLLDVVDENMFDITLQLDAAAVPWGRGDALTLAGRPATGLGQAVSGAAGGTGLGAAVFSLPLSHYTRGGGGGSGSLGGLGGAGGGVFRVLARGAIHNGGTIDAAGTEPVVNRIDNTATFDGAGCGGGAGGVVILASLESVDNSVPANANGGAMNGTIDVSGADGGIPDTFGGGGGGGGGGLAALVAPQVGEFGTVDTTAGVSGTQLLVTGSPVFCGGGGGGACVGDGGGGLEVAANGDAGPTPDGFGGFIFPPPPGPGQLLAREVDPRSLWQ